MNAIIEQTSSLKKSDWILYNILIHPNNKSTIDEISSMSICEVLDYKEMLDTLTMLELARNLDQEIIDKMSNSNSNR